MMSRLKMFLRKNAFYNKYLQEHINNIRLFWKNCIFYFHHYTFKNNKELDGTHTVFLVYDAEQEHPGLADRLKVICCAYYIALQNGFDFKLVFETPFKLYDYLEYH